MITSVTSVNQLVMLTSQDSDTSSFENDYENDEDDLEDDSEAGSEDFEDDFEASPHQNESEASSFKSNSN